MPKIGKKNHWKSIESAYRSSPYFEYYEQEFYDFFHKKDFELLVDFNTALMQKNNGNFRIICSAEIFRKIY